MKLTTIKRRKFIQKSSLLVAGAPLIWSCGGTSSETKAAGEAAVAAAKEQPGIGLQLYTLRNQLAEDLEGTLKHVADSGYDYVELFGYGERSYFGKPAAEFYELVKGYGLGIRSSHHLTGLANAPQQGTLTNGWEQAVEDAANAGQQYMVCAYLMDTERQSIDDYKKLTEILNKAGETAKAAGIQFCYHNHDFEFVEMDGEMPMYVMLDNTDPESVKVELDLYWITKAGLDPIDFFNKYPGRTALWHVKDMQDTPEQGFAEVGTGVIDFKRIFANAELSGMKSFFVEQDQSDDPKASIQTSIKNLKGRILS
jgi:sugar phosphate isomerase/epimerase